MKLKKAQLQKIWKQLDGACEALERLAENGVEASIDFTAVVSLKNEVEEMIEQKSRNKTTWHRSMKNER